MAAEVVTEVAGVRSRTSAALTHRARSIIMPYARPRIASLSIRSWHARVAILTPPKVPHFACVSLITVLPGQGAGKPNSAAATFSEAPWDLAPTRKLMIAPLLPAPLKPFCAPVQGCHSARGTPRRQDPPPTLWPTQSTPQPQMPAPVEPCVVPGTQAQSHQGPLGVFRDANERNIHRRQTQ